MWVVMSEWSKSLLQLDMMGALPYLSKPLHEVLQPPTKTGGAEVKHLRVLVMLW